MASEGRTVMVQGRLVWLAGQDPFKGATRKDNAGKLLFTDKGEPMMQYGFGLAVPKPFTGCSPEVEKNFMDIWNALHQEAQSLYPTGQIPPGFSFKYKDGDGVDHNGQPFANREGYKGCIVFAMTTTLPIKYFRHNGAAYEQINEGIKCGDYVQVHLNIKGHLPKPGTQSKPGVYLNPGLTLFLGYGTEIINAPDAASVFGATPPPMPQGASSTPIGGFAPANFGGFAQAAQTPAAPAAPAAPAWNGQPNSGVLPQQFQQPMQAPAISPGFGVQAPMGNVSIPTPGFAPPVGNQNIFTPGQQVQQPVNTASPFSSQQPMGMPAQPATNFPWQPK